MSNPYHVVNFHITNSCNYACRYCFGKFEGRCYLPLEDTKRIIDGICDYFHNAGILDGRVNLAGGEPMLYPYLDKLIDHIHSRDISASLVTNGSLLTPERVNSWSGRVACIGLSVDSLSAETNPAIGRCCHGDVKELRHWEALAHACHASGTRLKINTVVSRLNLEEDMTPLYRSCRPDRIKLFQVHLVQGVNDSARELAITEAEFHAFCDRYADFADRIVREPCGSMENSYLMVDPNGDVLLNNNGVYKTYGNCLTRSFGDTVNQLPLSRDRYTARYGGEVTP